MPPSPSVPADTQAVLAVVSDYFEFIHSGRLDLFDAIFHPSFRMTGLPAGGLASADRDAYRRAVADRTSPAAAGAARCDELLAFDITPGCQAFAKVAVQFHDVRYLDYLTLLYTDDGWSIVSKTYSHGR